MTMAKVVVINHSSSAEKTEQHLVEYERF